MFINIHTHSENISDGGVAIQSLFHDQVVPGTGSYSIGLHPWHIEWTNIENVMFQLETIVQTENVVAIGETGLDRARSTPMELQTMVLRRHIALAEKVQKPLVIHCVRAYPELIGDLKNVTVPVIIHGFRGNVQTVEQLVSHGFYISFGAALLESNEKLEAALKAVPLNQLFLETDEAENSIEDIYRAAAKILVCDVDELSQSLESNYRTVFDRKQRTCSTPF